MADGKIALIFTPLIVSFLASRFFGKVDSKDYVKASFQPPGYVFMFVWTALYIMFGFLLYRAVEIEDYLILGLVTGTLFLTYLWIYTFNSLKNYSLSTFVIFLTLLIALELLVALLYRGWEEAYLYTYTPFVAWIIFALLLSSFTKPKKYTNIK